MPVKISQTFSLAIKKAASLATPATRDQKVIRDLCPVLARVGVTRARRSPGAAAETTTSSATSATTMADAMVETNTATTTLALATTIATIATTTTVAEIAMGEEIVSAAIHPTKSLNG